MDDMACVVAWTVSIQGSKIPHEIAVLFRRQILTYVQDTHKIGWSPWDLARLELIMCQMHAGNTSYLRGVTDDFMYKSKFCTQAFPLAMWEEVREPWERFHAQHLDFSAFEKEVKEVALEHWKSLVAEENVVLTQEAQEATSRPLWDPVSQQGRDNWFVSLEGYCVNE